MELFVTIGICKVILCRLITLYIQYYLMSVFICVSLLPVLFCSRWFHQQLSEVVLFVAIFIANVIFYWEMVLHTLFLPVNFLFFCVSSLLSSSCYRWFQVVIACSRQFQLIPGSYSLFQVVSVHSRWLQLVPAHSSYFLVLLCAQNALYLAAQVIVYIRKIIMYFYISFFYVTLQALPTRRVCGGAVSFFAFLRKYIVIFLENYFIKNKTRCHFPLEPLTSTPQ